MKRSKPTKRTHRSKKTPKRRDRTYRPRAPGPRPPTPPPPAPEPSAQARPALRACQRHAAPHIRPARWFDLAEAFVTDEGIDDGDRSLAALLVALDLFPGMDALVSGRHIGLVSIHVFTYYDGGRIRSRGALLLFDRFLRWLQRTGRIDGAALDALTAATRSARESIVSG